MTQNHKGFEIFGSLEGGGKSPKENKKPTNVEPVTTPPVIADTPDKELLAYQEELNRLWLSPFNDAIWHNVGGF